MMREFRIANAFGPAPVVRPRLYTALNLKNNSCGIFVFNITVIKTSCENVYANKDFYSVVYT